MSTQGLRIISPPRYLAALLLVFAAAPATAQSSRLADSLIASRANRLVLIASPAEDRRRLDAIVGRSGTAGSLIRSPSASLDDTATISWRTRSWSVVLPYGEITSNSRLPFSLNDGAQWAGRGMTIQVAGGILARVGPVSLNLVPQFWHAQNQPFVVLPAGDTARSPFSSPWHFGLTSADLPLRFGYAPLAAFDMGESALWITRYGLSAGLATESQWWGPGIRNAILMSNNAGGFPHVFLRTAAPIRTRAGDVEARWIIGGLTESRFFDEHSGNDLRSLSGVVATLTPARERDLTLGLARVLYAPIGGAGALPARAFDVFLRWGDGGNVRELTAERAAEQMTSLFARWVFPSSGVEAYGEWSRIVLPTSFRTFLLAPQFTQGFTVGWQWMGRRASEPRFRVQLELTNLEQSPRSREADTLTYYLSHAVKQGYTQRGQVIGAAIGPGSSSQWFAIDRLARSWSVGAFAGRIRWQQDTYYRQPTSVSYHAYDMTMYSGVRGGWRRWNRELVADVAVQRRYNYLFQNSNVGYALDPAFDQRNVTLKLRLF